MSILSISWSNTQPNICEDLKKVREHALRSTVPITGPCDGYYGGMYIGHILAAVEYGEKRDRIERAKGTRHRKKNHKRWLQQKRKQ